jgi:hypothetical protein|tara:strand:- start:2193 stop:2369 length:177 start_codon:yes stop_codon:yes gene_type:complete
MSDTLKILANNPEIGLTTSLGSGLMHWLGIVNPVLSFVSLIIGISIGLVTLYAKIRNL